MQFGRGQTILWAVALFIAVGAVTLASHSTTAWGDDPCAVQHPFKPPNKEFSGQCPVCGMMRPMWARTWMTFRNSEGDFGVCSFHCLADKAFFVVGSKARGTMTMKSKLTFPSREAAEKFAKSCGGKVVGFAAALKMAKAGVPKENPVIGMKRLKMGKIVEPVDNKDSCPVCNMYPARYPKSKCQIMAKDKKVYHFCSTQCLFEFLKNAKKYAKSEVKPVLIWVVDYPSGPWIGARAAYYVVGSKVQGPMGHEAFPFDKKKAAEEFAKKEGGKVLVFSQVGPDNIMPK